MSQENIQYPCFKTEIFSLAHKDPYAWKSSNFISLKLKVLKILNITKTGVIKILISSNNSKNYAAAYYQTLEEVPGSLLQEIIQKHEKNGKNFQKLL